MLETIKQYANEKLLEAGEGNTLRDHHLDHFLTLAETAEPHLLHPEQLEWLAQLDTEYQNLRAAIDWGYNLLQPAEQVLFCRLSVFVGGCTLEAAESVCAGEATSGAVRSEDVLSLLEQLINKSFVVKEEAESPLSHVGNDQTICDRKIDGSGRGQHTP